ncbi:MAG: MBL fold metallo-hydrolase [Lachnospiraceae bacterium]|nr:MBL fold metallo-hydrolase [Lachnospiraceae bacterium]
MTREEYAKAMDNLNRVVKARMDATWTEYKAPFKVIENVYFVGTKWVSAFLIDTPEGLILLDCMYREVLYLLIDSIRALGFDPHNIKHLLLTHGHFDHCGAVREIQEMSNCEVWVSKAEEFFFTERRDLIAFEDHVAPFRIDHFYDYDKPIEFGGMKIQPVPCPGHTPGTTCLFFDVEHDGETLTLGMHGGLGTNGLSTLELEINRLPHHLQSDYLEHMLLLKDRKVDVVIPSHAAHTVDHPFFEIAAKDDGTGNGFIDRGAWKRMIEARIAMARELIRKEQEEENAK